MAAVNHVCLSEAITHNRFSAEFFDPKYAFKPSTLTTWVPIGHVLKKCEYGISISMNTEGKGYPIFRMNEFDDCFALQPEKYAEITKSLFDTYALKENDVLFNRTNSFEFVGRTGIIKDQTDCTFASYLIRLVPDPDRLLPEFLTIYLNTKFGIGQVKRRAMRSINQANVSGSEVRKVLIPLFDPKVQQQIADLVNAAFSLRKESSTRFMQAEQHLESELGLDKLGFQKPVSYTAHASELTTSFRTDAEYYDPIAIGIAKKLTDLDHSRLLDSFHIRSGFPWKSTMFVPDNSGEPVVRIRNIKPSYIDPTQLTSLVPAYARSIAFPKAKRGDVVIGMDGIKYFYGSVLEGECYVNQRVCHLTPRSSGKVSSEYATFIINSRVGQAQLMRNMTVATTVGHITNWDIAKLVVPTISMEFHDKITELVRKSIDAKEKSKSFLEQAKFRVEKLIEEAAQS